MKTLVALAAMLAAATPAMAETWKYRQYVCEVSETKETVRRSGPCTTLLDCEKWTEIHTWEDYVCRKGEERLRFTCNSVYTSGTFSGTLTTKCDCGFWGASSAERCLD